MANESMNVLQSENSIYYNSALNETVLLNPSVTEEEMSLNSSSLFPTLGFYNYYSSQLYCDCNGNSNNIKLEMVTKQNKNSINNDSFLSYQLYRNHAYNFGDRIFAKYYSPYGFKYMLYAPISTNQPIKKDTMTLLNKCKFYDLVLYNIQDPHKKLRSSTVKSIITLIPREKMSSEEEFRAWHFLKKAHNFDGQPILVADQKRSLFIRKIKVFAINAFAVYWSPLQHFAKIPIFINSLSTNFYIYKDGTGMPFNLIIDTCEDFCLSSILHRCYCQIEIICGNCFQEKSCIKKHQKYNHKKGVKYYEPCLITTFYSLSDLTKPHLLSVSMNTYTEIAMEAKSSVKNSSLDVNKNKLAASLSSSFSKVLNKHVVIFIRQKVIDAYTSIVVSPPTAKYLIKSIENKFKIPASLIDKLLCEKLTGSIIKLDGELLSYYFNENTFLMQVTKSQSNQDKIVIILIEEDY